MSDRSIQRKEDYLDWMHEKFCASSRAYVSAVKTALRSQTRENAAEIFERAIDVLSQDFPDPTSIDGQTQEEEGGDGNELNSLKDRIAQMERQLQKVQNERSTLESELGSVKQEAQTKCSILESESVRQEAQEERSTLDSELESVREEAQNNHSFFEKQLNSTYKKNVRLDAKFGDLKNKVETLATETKDSIKELTEVSKQNSANIQGLRKLQMFMKQKNQAAAAAAAAAVVAVTAPPTAPSASAPSRPLKDIRLRNTFIAMASGDRFEPVIEDVQLLPGRRLLLVDEFNKCVKLFNTQGHHLDTAACRGIPSCLAVLDSLVTASSNCHTVAVTLPNRPAFAILEVLNDKIQVKRTVTTTTQYMAVAGVNNQTLAVSYSSGYRIDLIDLDGQVLRQICSSVHPRYMTTTQDGDLVCSTWDDTIARVQVDTGKVVFDNSEAIALSVDYSKTIDTISTSLITHSLQLYDFGENFTRWINIILEDRKANIKNKTKQKTAQATLNFLRSKEESGGDGGDAQFSYAIYNCCGTAGYKHLTGQENKRYTFTKVCVYPKNTPIYRWHNKIPKRRN
ncbi:hypothetical protein PoB_001257400 [Plakobranchus ocellatus]|uniref:Uncharacterized protein n=1 Tax=Plakobranchus ocellatus TaxID=259542 RepID=A0AAV3YSM6_9GAST|nr:hypothetical protein PoB_001257400 [Plakobranchus ocellatus]